MKNSRISLREILFGVLISILTINLANANPSDVKTRGGLIAVIDGEDLEKILLLNGKPIYKADTRYLGVEVVYELGDEDAILIGSNSGGTSCPMEYFILSLKYNNKYRITPEFGTCSDLVKTSKINSSIVITMPNFNEKGNAKFIYRDGVIFKNGKPLK